MINKSVLILAAAFLLPAVAAVGQQNGSNGSSRSNTKVTEGTHHRTNYVMRTGSVSDTGGGLMGDYGNSQPGTVVHTSRHHRKHKNTNRRGVNSNSNTSG